MIYDEAKYVYGTAESVVWVILFYFEIINSSVSVTNELSINTCNSCKSELGL